MLKAKVLPQYSGASSLMAPQQASQLQVTLVLRIEWLCTASESLNCPGVSRCPM